MSILGFLFKSKKNMAKKSTARVKVGKYTLTSHAQNRMLDKTRPMGKLDVLDNLFTKPHGITAVKIDSKKQPSYNRVGKRITTSINPTNNNVTTCRPVSDAEIKKFDLINIKKEGRKKKYVKRNSKKQIYPKSKRSGKRGSR